MKLTIQQLKFTLPDNPFGHHLSAIRTLTRELSELTTRVGIDNKAFEHACLDIQHSIQKEHDLAMSLDAPIKLRALAYALGTRVGEKVTLTQRILQKINEIRAVPSTLLLESVYQFYLKRYDKMGDYQAVGRWLLTNLPARNLLQPHHQDLLGPDGPKWLVQEAIRENRELPDQIVHFGLDRYTSGRFMTVANSIYYVEQLKTIPVNQPHPLLEEVQKSSVYDSPYDEHMLIGHKVLEILISRSAHTKVTDSWLHTVLAIAGDPRVPPEHPKYQKWWSQLDKSLHIVVQGWLSKLDIRLFLEALEDFSNLPGKEELRRMLPARKRFLEGLYEKELINHVRLYLSRGADRYLRLNYKSEHLPEYSLVGNGDKSLIYVQLSHGQAHLIEGSHSCYLWIYRRLHESATVFNYAHNTVNYEDLTSGLDRKMSRFRCQAKEKIVHNTSWQRRAIETLKKIGINISAQDVLTPEEYQKFKRQAGII